MRPLLPLLPALILGMSCCSTKPAKMPAGKEVPATEIIRLLNAGEHIYLNGKAITGHLDFASLTHKYPEGAGTFRVEVPGSVTFIDCHFKGQVNAFRQAEEEVRLVTFKRNLSFVNCRFDEAADLRNIVVEGTAHWQKSAWEKDCRLTGATFERLADFEAANFIGAFHGQEMQFFGPAKFLNAVFENTANFQKAHFHHTAQFSVARFLGYSEFNSVWAERDFLFSYAQFHGRAFFQNARIDDRTEFYEAQFHQAVSLAKSRFGGEVKLQGLLIKADFSLEKCRFAMPPHGWEELKKQADNTINLTGTYIGQ